MASNKSIAPTFGRTYDHAADIPARGSPLAHGQFKMRSQLQFMLVALALFCQPVVAGAPQSVTFKDGFEDFVGCGDGQVSGAEACDDGNQVSADGCNQSCDIETGYLCTGEPSVCTTQCGDGLVLGTEACDDQNQNPGDGCDSSCSIEDGYICDGQPSVCSPET
jgi:cysteine-rich repeat protein